MPCRTAVLLLIVPAVVVAGCGGGKTTPKTSTAAAAPTTAAKVRSFVRVDFPAAGVSFNRPKGWTYQQGAAPLLATMNSGEVTIAVWRYPRDGAQPETPGELTKAKNTLVKAAKARDKTFKVIKAKGTRAAHSPAVVIVADETLAGDRRRVRSTHVYAHGAEIVVDAFASRQEFPKVEDSVFRLVVRSLRLTAPSGT